jgi:hypothetical protein
VDSGQRSWLFHADGPKLPSGRVLPSVLATWLALIISSSSVIRIRLLLYWASHESKHCKRVALVGNEAIRAPNVQLIQNAVALALSDVLLAEVLSKCAAKCHSFDT